MATSRKIGMGAGEQGSKGAGEHGSRGAWEQKKSSPAHLHTRTPAQNAHPHTCSPPGDFDYVD